MLKNITNIIPLIIFNKKFLFLKFIIIIIKKHPTIGSISDFLEPEAAIIKTLIIVKGIYLYFFS